MTEKNGNIYLSKEESQNFLHNLLHPNPEVEKLREDFLNSATTNTKYLDEDGITKIYSNYINEQGLKKAMEEKKIVTPAKTGKWLYKDGEIYCSECHAVIAIGSYEFFDDMVEGYHYCYSCGAKMENA